jgi:hypothetical protein
MKVRQIQIIQYIMLVSCRIIVMKINLDIVDANIP